MGRFIGLILFVGTSVAVVQKPFSTPPFPQGEQDEFQFSWPIQKVAIIGAGPNGIASYRELVEAGLEVRIFERESVPGGNWHYTEEIPLDAPAPNAATPVGDFVPSLPPAGVDLPYSEDFEDDSDVIWREHRAPKPIWESLTANLPSPVQQFLQWPWPPGTPWELTHHQVRNYVRSYAAYLNMNSNDENNATCYNTRVERVEKRINQAGQEQGWKLWLRKLEPTFGNTYRATWWTEDFDAVVVASGRYNAPSMPSIPGLDDWVQKNPGLIRHSRQYRRPETYTNQTVLIIGAANSGAEISRDLNRHVEGIYQSFRPSNNSMAQIRLERYLRRVPENTTFVGEIKQFLPIPEGLPIQSGLVELLNGTIISGIDSIILATGYRYCYPFLSQYYDGATYVPHKGSASTVSPFLPMDGSHIRDLYLDMFYISDPTLVFVGAVGFPPSFPYSDYTALAMAKVLANTARLPSISTMRELHAKTVEERGGYGKYSLYLGPARSPAFMAYLNGWLNQAAAKYGGKQIGTLPTVTQEIRGYWSIVRFGPDNTTKEKEAMLASLGFDLTTVVSSMDRQEVRNFFELYGDDW